MHKDPEIIRKLLGYAPVNPNQKFGMNADEIGVYSLNHLEYYKICRPTLESNIRHTFNNFIIGKSKIKLLNEYIKHLKDFNLDEEALKNNEPGHLIYGTWHRNSKYV